MLIFKIILYLVLSIIGIIYVWNKQELPLKKKIGASLGVLVVLAYFFLPSKENKITNSSSPTPQKTQYEVPKLTCDYCGKTFPKSQAGPIGTGKKGIIDDAHGTIFCSNVCYGYWSSEN